MGILPDDSPASLLKDDDMVHLRTTYGIPESIKLRAVKEHERPDWDISGWTCFYEYIL